MLANDGALVGCLVIVLHTADVPIANICAIMMCYLLFGICISKYVLQFNAIFDWFSGLLLWHNGFFEEHQMNYRSRVSSVT